MKSLFISFIFFIAAQQVFAQGQHALVIGIDTYQPPKGSKITGTTRGDFRNLEGCKNDAVSIRSLIQAKYGFDRKNIDTLFNRNATRENILAQLNVLLTKSNAGDIAFVYYAGHGSQQKNSLSKEEDKLDESIVPSDTWKPGVGDVRDKELAKIFNDFIDKGIKLTVILDCCHSGSMSRGPVFKQPKTRYIAANNYDAKDASNPAAPEERKEGTFLIISAAQDDELAEEQIDDNKKPHGAFTIALTEAIQQQSVDASALNLFKSIGVILKSNGKKQEPVLGGFTERQSQTLFGIARGKLADKMLIPISGLEKNKVTIDGGFAEGLYKGHMLSMVNDTNIVIRIDSVMGINESLATVIKGTASKIKVGNLFEVSNWVSSGAALLKLYVPESVFTSEQVNAFAVLNKQLKNNKDIVWINDLEKSEPYVSTGFIGTQLYANIAGQSIVEIKKAEEKELVKLADKKALFFNMPPSRDFAAAIKKIFKNNRSIELVSDQGDAQYILYGTIDDSGKPCYGLMRAQVSNKDSLESMPVQTRNFAASDIKSYEGAADSLYEYAKRLAKVRAWLTIKSPIDDNNIFPYHLELFNEQAKTKLLSPAYKIGDKMSLRLVADSNFKEFDLNPKFVYVFTIDKNGRMQLCFPRSSGSVESKYPRDYETTNYRLFGFTVSDPIGTDNYYMIASNKAIAGYSLLFNQEGTRGLENRGPDNPLANLLNIGNDGGTRGIITTPSTWNLLRLSVKSMH